jgi:hypothetical protein
MGTGRNEFKPVYSVAARSDGMALAGGTDGVYSALMGNGPYGAVKYQSVKETVFSDEVTIPATWLFCSGEHKITVVSADEAKRD